MLFRSMATSPSAAATDSSRVASAAVAGTGLAAAAAAVVTDGAGGATAAVRTGGAACAASRWTSIRCSTRSLICVVTSCMRCDSSPASDCASWPAASRSAAALLAYV